MKKVERNEIIDYQTYEDIRTEFRKEVMAVKNLRRITVGDFFTFLFENHLTVKYQIQEMIRAEKIVREKDIQREIDTYNEILGEDGELGCTFQVEIDDREMRDQKLKKWVKLPEHLYLKLENGEKVRCRIDERQRDEHRLSSVQFIKFDVKGHVPIAVGIDFPGLEAETILSNEQQAALSEDLAFLYL